nr:tRNA pseudouridine(38-40) synthase TruA [uncultured Holophaga sp.]
MIGLYYLRVSYDGSAFHGWQIQTTARSVQRVLWDALRALDPQASMPQGTGRTDAGVHARAQGVLITTPRAWDPYRLLAALNAHMPGDVRVMEVQEAPEGFFPRQHAEAKRYTYRLNEGPAEDPLERHLRWHIHRASPLDRGAMARAAAQLVGEHDFSSFRHRDCVAATPVRQVHRVELVERGSQLDLIFEGNRFLMHQVRIMAGTLVEVGLGRLGPDAIPGILEARDRSRAGQTAPPHGLCLEKVWYRSCWGIGEVYVPPSWAREV